VAYLYETHLHTAGVSKCAVSGGADYIEGYKDMGYSGIIVTDHFYNANCSLSRKLPWREWVKRFFSGYEDAKNEGERRGIDVFFGWEETFEGCDDYLIYGLDQEWLFEHPEVRHWTRSEQYRAVRNGGGCVVQAHPFRQRHYIHRIILSRDCVDGVETANAGNEQNSDTLAYHYAKNIGKTMTAGTDIHEAFLINCGQLYGVYVDKKLNSISDYVRIILNNQISGLRTEINRFDFHGTDCIKLPVEILNENDMVTSKNWKGYIF